MRRFATQLLCGLLVLLFTPALAWAQDATIRGVVRDTEGEPLPGATVQIQSLSMGAATDADGRYTIASVPAGTYTLQASFVGYNTQTKEITVSEGQRVNVNFRLSIKTATLDAVTVSGYRPTTSRSESGASVVVGSEELEGVSVRSPDAAIQGKAAGVRVTAASGQPGAGIQVNVRGAVSVNAGTSPLYIVDGVQVSANDNLSLASGNPLTSIAPSDIQSIEVLKDAAAASIYGAQAANGVVLITTKRGREGATRVNFSAQLGSADRTKTFNVLNTPQYLRYRALAISNAGNIPVGNLEDSFNSNGDFTGYGIANSFRGPRSVNENWQDLVFRTGLQQSYNLSVRGGNEDTQFYISGRFGRDEGQIIESAFKQGGLRANLSHDVNDKLTLESTFNFTNGHYRGTIGNGAFINSPFWAAQFIPPTASLYNEPGNPASGFNLEPNNTFSYNPVAQEKFNTRNSVVNTVIANVSADYQWTDDIASRTFAGVQYEDVQEENYDDPRLPANAGVGGSGFARASRTTSFNISQTVAYDKLFADVHNVSVLLGGEVKRELETGLGGNAQGFPSFLFRKLSQAAEPTGVFQYSTEYRQLSVFGNVEYTYDNTYQISATVRRDGNSRFGESQRYGTFGTVAGYWRVSNMGFLQDIEALSNLKLRASYGVTGNSDINNFISRQSFLGAGEYNGSPGLRPNSIGNNQLSWEEKWSTNIGLDYGLFGGRISGAVDVWRDRRTELLLNRDLPVDSGFGSIIDNVGEITVEGIDVLVNTTNIDYADFRWDTSFNISFQRTEVNKLLPGDDTVIAGGLYYVVGEPVAQSRYVRYAGANPANGRPMYYDADGDLTYVGTNVDDEKLVGNTQPDFLGGLTNSFSFKGISLSVFFQYDYGRTTLNNNAFFSDVGYFSFNKADRVLDGWRQPGDVTEVPKPYGTTLLAGGTTFPDGTTEGIFTTRFVENASYIRLKRVRLGYSLPSSLLAGTGLRSVEIYGAGANLVTWTNFTGPDPELVGTALGDYPQAKTITGGINIGF
ncbi:SusC/RagA family TonB-linked outer membrane protein [Salisaeta longa]|uniref:SusC/RagA family TonB-linked outer membrane protein n=1 Tax=Salisaeta longa TaxID=503170 RepID=UPI0003B5968E|nr:SusC/RagA family TonB-linked outer membrane protein [Salisaeta longa]